MNIHPGITRLESPYERRGRTPPGMRCTAHVGRRSPTGRAKRRRRANRCIDGASFHYVDNGIDSGEVFHDVLKTEISPEDTILELRWNNFNNSLFPALHEGLSCWPSKAEPCRSELARENVNDYLRFLNKRGVCEFFASKLAPTRY